MRIELANNPDIALAQEWACHIDAWFERHGAIGPDPFDIKAHPLMRRMQRHKWPRRCATLACDLFPHASRRLLRIPPTDNPKTHALLALGGLRLFQTTQDAYWLDKARAGLDWLLEHPSTGFAGLCWGYPFAVSGQGLDTPPGTPVAVISAIAGEAFALAHEVTGDTRHLESIQSIARFMLGDLPRLGGPDGTHCFGYTPGDRRRVHNANLLVVEHLCRAARLTGMNECLEPALPALAFTLRAQRDDGAWPYGHHAQDDPYEAGLLNLVDHHHSGFVLRSLQAIGQWTPDNVPAEGLERGFRFYRTRLMEPSGMPVNEYARFPVDIHACAEAILCPSALSPRFGNCHKLALASMRWTHEFLRDPRTGAPWHRRYPMHVSRITFPRWGAAWMFRALAEYLYRFQTSAE
jgi:hypothetical protein